MQVNSVFIMLIKLQNLAALNIKWKYKTLQGRQAGGCQLVSLYFGSTAKRNTNYKRC